MEKYFNNKNGYGILDIMATLVISSVLGYSAVINLPEFTYSYQRYQARSTFVQHLRETQARAITQGCRGLLTISPDKHSYQSGCDYLTYDTTNPPSLDKVFLSATLPDHVFLSVNKPIFFNSKGQATDVNGNLNMVLIGLTHSANPNHEAFSSGVLLGTGMFSYTD